MSTATETYSTTVPTCHTSATIVSQVDARITPSTPASSVSKKHHREVRFGAYILGSTLGEGEFGKVKLGWRKDGSVPNQVAIKLIRRDTIMKDSESEIKIYREINSLRLLNHPHIVNLVEVLKSGKYIGIVLEYASGGELFDFILRHKYLKENVARKLFAQLVSGVDYMHSKGLVHRDLKLENLLLDKHKNIIISDFGFVNSFNRNRSDLMKTSCGSPCYAAPELVLSQSPYAGQKVDIWSLGVILYAMLAGYLPFDDDADNEDGADIVKLYNYICSNPLTFPEYITPLARDLLRKIIVPDPAKRISMDEIRSHPWLASYSSLLSMRQPDWDRITTESRGRVTVEQTPGQAKYKRHSMFTESTNSSSLILNSHKPVSGRLYTSNSNFIYSNPTTSSSLANVVALAHESLNQSTSSLASNASSALASQNEERHSPVRLQQGTFKKGHSKAASMSGTYTTASSALKAVVLDDRSETRPAPQSPQKDPLARSSTYTGNISTIIESPTHTEFKLNMDTLGGNISPLLDRLPHNRKKPRPTSYHPGSISSSLIALSGPTMEYIKPNSPVSLPVSQFLSGSPIRSLHGVGSFTGAAADAETSPSSMASLNAIPPRTHRRDSVVTPINVNGVLSHDLSSHENKRNSVLSYLEDKMEVLELTDLHSPSRTHFVAEDFSKLSHDTEPTTAPIYGKTVVLDTHEINESDKPAKLKEPMAVQEIPFEKKEASRKQKTPVPEPIPTPRMDHNKENRQQKEAKKRNRFSILSFYGNSEDSPSPQSPSSGRRILEPSHEANVSHLTYKHADTSVSSGSAQLRKISSSTTSSNTYVNGKEASAARKVMNFFKRRSVKIG